MRSHGGKQTLRWRRCGDVLISPALTGRAMPARARVVRALGHCAEVTACHYRRTRVLNEEEAPAAITFENERTHLGMGEDAHS